MSEITPIPAPVDATAAEALGEAEQRIQRAAITRKKTLSLSGLGLSILPEAVFQLTELEVLELNDNRLTELPESIGLLKRLRSLDIRCNRLTSLPRSMRNLPSLTGLYLHRNEGLGLPGETLELLRTPTSILDYYFQIFRGARPLNEAKLILVGRGGVGKTCLIKRLVYGTFDEREPETPGIEIQPWQVTLPDGDAVRLHVWDFGGQEILHATHQFFLTERTLYLLVLSGREGNPTQDAEYWLQLIKSFGDNSRVLVSLNKSRQHPFDVNRGLLLEKYPNIAGFVITDCQAKIGLRELEGRILDETDRLEHRKTNFPDGWFAIKELLARMKDNYVTWERYQEICRGLGEQSAEEQRKLADFLHILGIALNYREDPRLRDTSVLNPRWVTEGIYSVLHGGQKMMRGGVLRKSDLAYILDSKNYSPSQHDFLLRLMEKFQLCFRVSAIGDAYLVPELLGDNQPDIKDLLAAPGLGFRYQYQVLPEGMLPRFIVQTHGYSEHNPRWRSGVVLERDGCRAVVRADIRERRVDIHITGRETQRRELLAIIRDRFDAQHRDLNGLIVDERVPIPGEPNVTVSYQHLIDSAEDGEEWVRPEGMRKKVRVAELLNGVESPESRARTQVFLSYSHKDIKFLEELRAHLKPLVRARLGAWSDQDIAPGSTALEAISRALATAKVAVMLVSAEFLASDYIHDRELGPLLQRAANGGLRILWVPVGACSYKETPLEHYRPVRSPDKPLALLRTKAERDRAWVEICKMIKAAMGA